MALKKNILANYLGQGWTTLMKLIFIPLYIHYLGMEAYGLIGVFTVTQTGFLLLDMGMIPTLNREMARFTAGAHTSDTIRELLHSIEVVFICIAFLITISVWAMSDWFVQHWLRVGQLPLATVNKAIFLMGFIVALRFIESLYRSAILGLQTQVWLNAVTAILETARWCGAVGLLAFISPDIVAFFLWQGCISIVTVIIFSGRVHRVLPPANHPVHFSRLALSGAWNFSRGILATTFLTSLLANTDKILLSRLLTLNEFGIYTLASSVANPLLSLAVPLAQSYYPRFTELVTRQDRQGLILSYHQGAQLMTVMVVPAALMLIFYGETVLYLWTGNAELAKSSSPLVRLLALGTAFLGLMEIPYMLQLAYGWSMFSAKVNTVVVAVMIPALFWVVPHYGAIGAAWVWVAITSSYIFLSLPIMHHRLLPKEKWHWYGRDTALPTVAAATVVYAGVWIHAVGTSRFVEAVWLIVIGVSSFSAALLSTSSFQKMILQYFREKV